MTSPGLATLQKRRNLIFLNSAKMAAQFSPIFGIGLDATQFIADCQYFFPHQRIAESIAIVMHQYLQTIAAAEVAQGADLPLATAVTWFGAGQATYYQRKWLMACRSGCACLVMGLQVRDTKVQQHLSQIFQMPHYGYQMVFRFVWFVEHQLNKGNHTCVALSTLEAVLTVLNRCCTADTGHAVNI